MAFLVPTGKKMPISSLKLIILHITLGAGIAYIGQKTKNKNEILAGIAVIVLQMLFLFITLSSACPQYCIFVKNLAVPGAGCANAFCAMIEALRTLLTLSYIYVILRLTTIWLSHEVEINRY